MFTQARYQISESALVAILESQQIYSSVSAGSRARRVAREQKSQMTLQESGILRVVSITEAFMDGLSRQTLIPNIDERNQFQAAIFEQFEINSSANWPSRLTVYKDKHGIKWKDCPGHRQFDAAIQLRNCIAHGLGQLTPRQQRDSGLGKQMSLVDVRVGGARMHISNSTLPLVSGLCSSLIRHIDQQI